MNEQQAGSSQLKQLKSVAKLLKVETTKEKRNFAHTVTELLRLTDMPDGTEENVVKIKQIIEQEEPLFTPPKPKPKEREKSPFEKRKRRPITKKNK